MKGFYLEQIDNFLNEFNSFLEEDSFIPTSKIDDFFDRYKDIIVLSNKNKSNDKKYKKFIDIIKNGYDYIDYKNEKYINKKLIDEKDYFDNMFKNIDSEILLDEEQRRAILIDEDYNLIVAGAGSGKTTTMAAKVKYLVEKKHVKPNKIILLSFTNASVDDLNKLINEKFKLNVEVLTFHKLGMKFLRGSNNSYEIVGDAGIYKILEDYFLNVVFKDKKLLKKYIDYFPNNKLKIDNEALKYNSYDEYYTYYMYEKLTYCRNHLKEQIRDRINNRKKFLKTINGEYVKSLGEFNIANYLYRHSIDYTYEEVYPYAINDNRTYKPDFTIHDFDKDIYLEYFGLARLEENYHIESEYQKYKDEIFKKIKNHKNNNTDLIKLYGRYYDKSNYLMNLSLQLTRRKIEKKDRSNEEVFLRLLETSKASKYNQLISLFINFISTFKEKGYQLNDFNQLIDNCKDENIKEQLLLLKYVFIYYENRLRENNRIDFEDMINYAYNNIENFKDRKKHVDYEYVIIDEYQDVSYQKYNFVKKISDLFKAKIVAVGDDWQTIYSFSGSDMDLFVNFEKMMGHCEITKILNTYRNSQELINTAGEFILQNDTQIEKKLISKKHLDKPIRLVEYDYEDENNNNYLNEDDDEDDDNDDESSIITDELIERLVVLLKRIYKARPKNNVLLLTRFNSEIRSLMISKYFYKDRIDDNKIICNEVPNMNIDIMTVHKSKGLGYDRVILLNGVNRKNGFPSKKKDADVIKYLKNEMSLDFEETIEYPEERRLFYVAMTRTKNEFFILTPNTFKGKSEFVTEISNNENVKIVENI